MNQSQRAQSTPILNSGAATEHDWAAGWDAHPTCTSASRWTFGGSDKVPPGKKSMAKFKMTYIDAHMKKKMWVPGAGTHQTRREYEPYPEEVGPPDDPSWKPDQRVPKWQEVVDRSCPHKFSKTTRQASLTDLRKVRTTLLPTSYMSPGPGAYTAFSTFGAPSGPTRKRYFAVNKGDISAFQRPAEEFKHDSGRGMENRNFSQQRKPKP